jgi:hypothetical protein
VVDTRWHVYKGDRYGHVIKIAMSGSCLMRGDQGRASFPSLYRWTQGPDNVYCGMRDRDEFWRSGQASWYLDVDTFLDARRELLTYSGRVYLGTEWSERFPGQLAVASDGQLTFSTHDRSWIFDFHTIAP